jgi:hypothetical protein
LADGSLAGAMPMMALSPALTHLPGHAADLTDTLLLVFAEVAKRRTGETLNAVRLQ